MIRYHLGPDFLDLKNLGLSLTFSVGDKPAKDFLMIEIHYFNEILIKSFEFIFDFCIPNQSMLGNIFIQFLNLILKKINK